MQLDKYSKNLLELLNAGKPIESYLVTRKLSDTVQLARIWSAEEKKPPKEIYLLIEKENYIGTVQEQETTLYAYTLTASRRKGYMKAALQETILPHLLQKTPILRVNISRSLLPEKMYFAAKQLALMTGFEILKEENGLCRLLIDGTQLQKRIFIQGENIPLTKDENTTLKNLIQQSIRHVSIAQCMKEYREGRGNLSEELLELTQKMRLLLEKMD